jgi:MarR family transcriptional regulator, organic hydroperoxide resistance regulator
MTEGGAETVHPVKGTTGFALAKVCRSHRGNVGGMLAEFGLHVGQDMVLVELWQADGLRGGELACRLGVEPPTVTKMLRRLENFGLVERRPDPADARSFRVYLTREGQALEGPVSRCFARAEEKTLARLEPSERRELARLLAKMRAGLEANRN